MKDVVIIGGGIVGLWCAWHLNEAGVKVTVLDRGDFTEGCSHGNAGMIVPSHFIPLASPGIISKGIDWMVKKNSPFYIRPRFNLELAQWLWQFYRSASKKHVMEAGALLVDMHTESRELYKKLDHTPGFNYLFEQKGILMLFKSIAAERDELEMAEAAERLGVEANYLTPEQLSHFEPGIQMSVKGAIHYPGDAHLSPHIFMKQMFTHLQQAGVELLPHHEVLNIEDKGTSGSEISLKDGKKTQAKHVVIAAGSWAGKMMNKSGIRLPIQDGKGYSMTINNPEVNISIPSILHEARVAMTPMGNDLRISGTLEISGMDEQVNKHKVDSILKAVPEYYPELKIRGPGPVWYGYRPCTPDGLPYIGPWRQSKSILIAAGHAMMGLSLAPVTGRMIRDFIMNPERYPTHSKLASSRFSS